MVERWIPVAGREGYEVSDQGRIRSYRDERGHPRPTARIMVMSSVRGYTKVKFGRGRMYHLAAVVLENFVGPRPPEKMARHLDGNPANNRLSNLAWGTAQENYDDRRRHGTANDGMRNGRAKLTNAQVCEIQASDERSVKLAKRYGVSPVTIGQVRRGHTWKAFSS